MTKKLKLFVSCRPGLESFIRGPVAHWSEKYDVSYFVPRSAADMIKIHEGMGWADVAWFEWGDGVAVQGSNMAGRCPMIVRVHGYEVFGNEIQGVNWNGVQAVITGANHKADILGNRFPDLSKKIRVIRYGVDTEKFKPQLDKQYNRSIVYAGHMNWRKDFSFALVMLRHLCDEDDEWRLTFVREIDDPRYQWAMLQQTFILGLQDNVMWEDRVDDLAEELQRHSVVISTSLEESFHYTLAEGMACGLFGVCRMWPEAEELYPEGCLVRTETEAARVILNWWDEPDKAEVSRLCRDWIAEHYALDRYYAEMDEVVEAAMNEGEQRRAESMANYLMQAQRGLPEPTPPPYSEYFQLLGIQPGEAVLELNCRTGRFLQAALAEGYRAIGVDGNHTALEIAKKNVPAAVLLDEGAEKLIEANSVRYMAVAAGLSKGNEAEAMMGRALRLLAVDGRMVVGCANVAFPGTPPATDFEHERMDTEVGWREFFEAQGFQVLDVRPYNGPFNRLPDEQAYRFLFLVGCRNGDSETDNVET